MKRLQIAIGLLFVLAGLLYWFGDRQPGSTRAVPVEDGGRLSIGISQDPIAWLAVIAAEGGLFEQQGLSPSIRYYPSGKRALQGMLNGDVEFSTSAGVPIAFAGFDHDDFRVLATLGSGDDEVRVVARRDHGIERPEDLRGRRVATQSHSAVHFFLDLFLLKHGLGGDVTTSFLPKEGLLDALARGEIDAISTREPFLSQAVSRLGAQAVVFSEPGLYRKSSHLTVRQDALAAKPQTANAVLRGLLEAERLAIQAPEQVIRIISAKTGVSPAEVRAVLPSVDLRLRFDQSALTSLEDAANWAVGQGFVGRRPVPNYLELMHPRLLKALSPAAVSIVY